MEEMNKSFRILNILVEMLPCHVIILRGTYTDSCFSWSCCRWVLIFPTFQHQEVD